MIVDTSPDYHDADAHANKLLLVIDEICDQAQNVGKARTILKFAPDRKKMAQAFATKRAREAGAKSMTEAECYGLASTEYAAQLFRLEAESLDAEIVVQQHQARELQCDALRSIVALERQKAGII